MKSFKHTISYKQEEDQEVIQELLKFNEIPTTIKIKPILFEKNSVSFIVNNKHFEDLGWFLPYENQPLIINTFVSNNPKMRNFEFKFIMCHSPNFYGVKN